MTSRSLLLDDLAARHLVNQMTAETELRSHLTEGDRTLYCGFDPTADSLHIGSLVPLLALRRFQLFGHKPIALVGGATGLIGDPSFKTEERRLNTPDIVEGWVHKIENQLSRFIDFDAGSCSATVVNNLDWVGGLDVLTFLRDVGKHFSVNAMIQKESVKQRIEREGDGISYTEFTYMILQAYDFAELYRRHKCTLQIGGSDQWGNITAGTDLTRRLHHVHVHGLTLPLVTKSDGTKFGKTETGTVWLDPVKTSPYAFYQFWINTADADAYRFLRYFTFLQPAEINAIEQADKASEGRKTAQSVLARQVTELVHGLDGVVAAERISHALFSGDIGALTEKDFQQLSLDGMPCTRICADQKSLVEILVETGLALTPRGDVTVGQARKFIQQQAIVVNNDKVLDAELMLNQSHALFGQFHLLRRGKKNFHLLVWA